VGVGKRDYFNEVGKGFRFKKSKFLIFWYMKLRIISWLILVFA